MCNFSLRSNLSFYISSRAFSTNISSVSFHIIFFFFFFPSVIPTGNLLELCVLSYLCLNLSYFTSVPLCSILCYLLRSIFQFTKIILFRCVKSASNLCTFFYTSVISSPHFFSNFLRYLQLFIL